MPQTGPTSQQTNPHAVLEAALAKERAAHRFYDSKAQTATLAVVRDLLLRLKDEEAKHIRLIEGLLAKLDLG